MRTRMWGAVCRIGSHRRVWWLVCTTLLGTLSVLAAGSAWGQVQPPNPASVFVDSTSPPAVQLFTVGGLYGLLAALGWALFAELRQWRALLEQVLGLSKEALGTVGETVRRVDTIFERAMTGLRAGAEGSDGGFGLDHRMRLTGPSVDRLVSMMERLLILAERSAVDQDIRQRAQAAASDAQRG